LLSPAQAGPTITTFDAPGSVYGTYAASINSVGAIAGSYFDDAYIQHGFIRFSDGSFVEFDAPGATGGTSAQAINAQGSVTGSYADPNGLHGFVRTIDGTITSFEAVPGDTSPCCINGTGTIAGGFISNDAGDDRRSCRDSVYHGFERSSDGTITKIDIPGAIKGGTILTGLSSKGWTTGHFLTCSTIKKRYNFTGFIRAADGTITSFAAADDTDQTLPCCINGTGWTTGFYYKLVVRRKYRQVGFVRSPDGAVASFDASGDQGNTIPAAINAAGEIVGASNKKKLAYRGFVRDPSGMITLFDVPGQSGNINATDVNGDGTIAGVYYDASNNPHGFVRTP
jgi:hypothetical protein